MKQNWKSLNRLKVKSLQAYRAGLTSQGKWDKLDFFFDRFSRSCEKKTNRSNPALKSKAGPNCSYSILYSGSIDSTCRSDNKQKVSSKTSLLKIPYNPIVLASMSKNHE